MSIIAKNELLSGNIELRKHFDEQKESLEAHIADVLENHIPDEGPRTKDAFVLSGSLDGGSLTLWRNYGRQQVSFAVGFDKEVPLVPMIPEEPKDGVELEAQKRAISEVFEGLREAAEEENTARGQFGLLFRAYLMHETLHFIKNAGFQDEREERIVMWLSPDWRFVCHRAGPYGLMPHIKLTALAPGNHTRHEEGYATKPGKLPIREIRIGPSPYSLAAVESLKQLLGFHGLHDVKVSYSEIPFR